MSEYAFRRLKELIELGLEEFECKEHTSVDKHKSTLANPNTSAAQLLNVTPDSIRRVDTGFGRVPAVVSE